jgi:CheY-like chemotaxis protein/signal transduction histidine kinase/CHASE3 domain sensor protein
MTTFTPSPVQLSSKKLESVANLLMKLKFFNNLSIGARLSIGFGILVLLSLLMSGSNFVGAFYSATSINRIEGVIAPTALEATRAQADLLRMLGSLRGYLALGDPKFREDYQQAKVDFEANLAQIEKLAQAETDSTDDARIRELIEKYETWSKLPEQMFALRDDTLANQPALRIMSESAQPSITLIETNITPLLREQSQRNPSANNMALLKDIADFQNSFSSMVSALRGYLITLDPALRFEYQASLIENRSAWEKLVAAKPFLTPNQQATLGNIVQAREKFLTFPPQMFEAAAGDHAREDLFLLRDQAEPLAGEMFQILDEVTLEQQNLLQAELTQSSQNVFATQLQALGGGIASFVLGVGLAFIFRRNIIGPITRLTEVTVQIAAGSLEAQAPVEANDEIGTLARNFNLMTSELRQTLERLKERAHALEISTEINQQLSTILDLDQLLAEVVNQIHENFGYDHAQVYLIDDDRRNLVLIAGTGEAGAVLKTSGHHIPVEANDFVAHAARTGEIVQSSDVRQAPDWLPNPLLPDTRSEMAVPIMLGGRVDGVLDVQMGKVAGLNEEDAKLLRSVASQVAVALTNARLFEQTIHSKEEAESAKEKAEQARQEIEIANQTLEAQIWLTTGQAQLNDMMQGEQDLSTLANNIIHQVCHYLQVQLGALYLADGHSLTLAGSYAYSSHHATNRFKFGEGLVGQAAVEKQRLIITDVPEGYITVRSGLGEIAPRHILIFPFMYKGQVLGVIELGTLSSFMPGQIDFLQIALESIAIAFYTAQVRSRINELLAETQQQAEALQAQGEELRVANEELASQTESLKTSEAALREKQAELEAINTQLEEKARALEESSIALREKQARLDKQNRELKAAQQELEKKAEELGLASKYKSEFLANMSHELRTPLNSLLILARMLVDNPEGNLTEEQVESIRIIYGSGTDLLNLINDILDLSKVESGKMTFNFEAMPFTDLEFMVRSQFAHVAEEKGVELNISLSDDLPAGIETDPQRIKQIAKNLLSNAFKFTTSGSVSFNICRAEAEADLSRSGLEPGQAIAISVVDTGIGMTAEQQKIIFEAFQQADGSTSRKYGGTGLGLSICRELAARLGGQIDVTSEVGKGSTFTLYLPIKRKTLKPEADSIHASPAPSTPLPSKPAELSPFPAVPMPVLPADDRTRLKAEDKILVIIEDDPNFAKVLSDYAHKKGFKCLLTGEGKTGVDLVKTYRPEAILLDLNLPDISGWEALDRLKNEPGTRHIPIHIISADEESFDAYRKGVMGYLTKPVSQEGLAEAFEKIEQITSRQIKALLLVEDDANARHSLKKLLGGSDVQISEADRGQTALELLKTQHFDCLILDLSLPDMSGFEVLNRIHQNGTIPKCPVIVYTGRDLSPEENLELMKYADRVIVKGVKSPERLLDETALFLHRVVADMPNDKQQTIKQLYHKDGLLKDKKILIVDDDMRNSFALSKLLSDKGVIVKIAKDGQKALEVLAQEPQVDLVLMDIMMPVLDGYETTRRIRAQQRFKNLPILALTAKAMKEDREKCLAAGANDYLSKPVDVDRLFSMLRVWLYQ